MNKIMIRSEALTTIISGEISAASTPVTSILGGQSINNNLTDIDEVWELKPQKKFFF